MGNLNYIVFGGVDSRDYGIYISGEGVFNAPERDVEVVNIPGKDGDLLIDRGRFLNIQVTYPGFNFKPDLSTFAERLRAFRAALASQAGYQRLEDSFHPDEFRLASFRSGLDVNPVMYNTASTFDIVFDCKPQRFLKSGEEEITIGQWGETETVSGSIATFEAESNTGIKSLVVDIEPVQSGTGDPSPDNVRPISGWSGVNVNATGVNIWDEQMELGLLNADGSVTPSTQRLTTKNYISVKEGVEYCMSAPSSAQRGRGAYYDESFNLVDYMSDFPASVITSGNRQYGMFTPPSGAKYLKVCTTDNYGTTYNNDISINYPSTDHEYHPYQGETITKSLGRTVYGGTLDLISGLMTVDKAYYNFDGSEAFSIYRSYTYGARFVTPALDSNAKTSQGVVMTNRFSYGAPNSYINISSGTSRTNFYIRSGDLGEGVELTVANLKSWLSSHNVQVVYELATPLTYQLTPETIQTLLGVNNIWADSGEVSVEYGEDPNLLINPSPFEALPLIEVVGVGSLTVGNITVTITGESTQDIFIDSDIMEAYEDDNGAIISRNDRINLSGMHFPTLGTETGITNTGLTSVTVTPRWWTI